MERRKSTDKQHFAENHTVDCENGSAAHPDNVLPIEALVNGENEEPDASQSDCPNLSNKVHVRREIPGMDTLPYAGAPNPIDGAARVLTSANNGNMALLPQFNPTGHVSIHVPGCAGASNESAPNEVVDYSGQCQTLDTGKGALTDVEGSSNFASPASFFQSPNAQPSGQVPIPSSNLPASIAEQDGPASSSQQKRKRQKPSSRLRKARTSKTTNPGEGRYWTKSEHRLYIEALSKYGYKQLKEISEHVGTRSLVQCRTHQQKFFMRKMREATEITVARDEPGVDWKKDNPIEENGKPPKDLYTLPKSCGLVLLSLVGEALARKEEVEEESTNREENEDC